MTDGAAEDPELALDGSPVAIVTCCAATLSATISPSISNDAVRIFVFKRRSKLLVRMNVWFESTIEVNPYY